MHALLLPLAEEQIQPGRGGPAEEEEARGGPKQQPASLAKKPRLEEIDGGKSVLLVPTHIDTSFPIRCGGRGCTYGFAGAGSQGVLPLPAACCIAQSCRCVLDGNQSTPHTARDATDAASQASMPWPPISTAAAAAAAAAAPAAPAAGAAATVATAERAPLVAVSRELPPPTLPPPMLPPSLPPVQQQQQQPPPGQREEDEETLSVDWEEDGGASVVDLEASSSESEEEGSASHGGGRAAVKEEQGEASRTTGRRGGSGLARCRLPPWGGRTVEGTGRWRPVSPHPWRWGSTGGVAGAGAPRPRGPTRPAGAMAGWRCCRRACGPGSLTP